MDENTNKAKKRIMRILYNLFAKWWWPMWSNFRFRNCIRKDTCLKEEDTVHNLTEIKALVKKLYEDFDYERDSFDQLGDAITPPPQNYKYYLDKTLKDDCDGFHSLVYHCLYNSGIECYLLGVCAIGCGHCVLLFKYKDKWYVNDYTKVYPGFETAQEAINNYNDNYIKLYGAQSTVYINHTIKYTYDNGKFKTVRIKDLK